VAPQVRIQPWPRRVARPIVILTTPRSGSSLVAGLFAAHGVWVGKTIPITSSNPKGNFEGTAVGSVLDRHYGALVGIGECGAYQPFCAAEIVEAIRADGYASGPWLWKGSAMYWRAFIDLDPIIVTVRREEEAIKKSNTRCPRLGRRSPAEALVAHRLVLDKLEDYGRALRVDSELLIDHDYRQIVAVFHRCGIEFDVSLADYWIEPDLWHF
jgi:hypothetical protein